MVFQQTCPQNIGMQTSLSEHSILRI